MTTPTPLSPAAEAVLRAAGDSEPGIYATIAAALRAAADHLNAESPWLGHIESTGVNWSRNELHKIANELGAQP
jgi:hypothetical protein